MRSLRPPVLLLAAFALVTVFLSHASGRMNIRQEGNYRYMESDGLPDHEPGTFPNAGNPNRITAQEYSFRVPLRPRLADRVTPVTNRLFFGVGRNGVPFDPGTAEFYRNDPRSGWNYEALSGRIDLGLDRHNAHVQPGGAYHYHGLPAGLMGNVEDGHSRLIGYAADGFPVFAVRGYRDPADPSKGVKEVRSAYRLKSGQRPSGPGGAYDGTFVQDYEYVARSGDLDECNGRIGIVPGYPQETYHYFLTRAYPFVPRCLKGTPDPSFNKSGPAPGGRRPPGADGNGPPGMGRRPPAEALAACRGRSAGAECSFQAPHGTIYGTCRRIQERTACVPGRRP